MATQDSGVNDDFKRLKAACVPLLGASRLTPASNAATSALLVELIKTLSEIPPENLTSNLISYVFLPLSTILQRNSSAEIPNQILEKILVVLRFLLESWWWSCDIKIWEQVFMLCSAVIGGLDEKSNSKVQRRDDETKEAATRCLLALMRPRALEDAEKRSFVPGKAEERLAKFQEHTQNPRFIPIVGQTLDSAMVSVSSSHLPLQRASLETAYLLIDLYLPNSLIPSVLPGVVSTMTKICLGLPQGKGWANGEIVARGLEVMRIAVIKAIGDEACLKDGAIRRVDNLEDFVNPTPSTQRPSSENETPYGVQRTESWLRGTSTQLHIAINSISSLLSHPTPSALHGLAKFSAALIRSTALTLPLTQPLLLSFLLSLSLSDYSSVSSEARQFLTELLTVCSDAQILLQRTVMANLGDNLSALPRLLATQADARVTHAAGLITAVCHIGSKSDSAESIPIIAKGIGKLLGPTGGIEKWGWSLLSVLEVVEPPVVVTHTSSAQLALESDPETPNWVAFPELIFSNISSHETRDALKTMFHALGAAGVDSCLYAVDWFIGVGTSGTSSTSVAALWCGCRLLEGIAQISLSDERGATISASRISKRLGKEVRILAKDIAETWDRPDDNWDADTAQAREEENPILVQHQKGIIPLHETLKITNPSECKRTKKKHQPIVHRALSLQLIAIAAGIEQARFSHLFIHTLYPVLHSLVSPVSFLSSTALATLNFITVATSYASPANLLLSNFDYVLDSVSRRLTQRWLDIDATKVLGIMIRLVGADVVEKAGDVVEECFDRLDQYHGYGLIVDGLIEVLMEVIKVIDIEARASGPVHKDTTPIASSSGPPKIALADFFASLPHRLETTLPEADSTDYGPAPGKPWGEQHTADEAMDGEEDFSKAKSVSDDEPPPTPVQALTKQIISRSLYFLTHDSPAIRTRILTLLTLSVPVLPESALLPSIHSAWPFILNRLGDSETFVVSAAATLIEALAKHVGEFMFRRIWDDVWPKFRLMLRALESGEATNALTRRGKTRVGTESAYTHSHRLYRSILNTMTCALRGVHEHEVSQWEVIVIFRRFLDAKAHEELQQSAIALYSQAGKLNPESVWLALTSTIEELDPIMAFLKANWDIKLNTDIVLRGIH
ncbi:hypothetical protein GALMADRAFT_132161 [Galerina marginata CBS 339.88]|uniref:Uncharacterized protein n=1 Tax=Galerina marginata (strain CBS 339.88) TaxID=685588 RepID=A0A067U273_GALM3|nr:hypothetical protein GALMADRAFT_132161 [Galerina marginata CBS 339.88]